MLRLCCWKFLENETLKQTFNGLGKKRQIRKSEPHFGEARGDAQPWSMARLKAHGRLSIRVN